MPDTVDITIRSLYLDGGLDVRQVGQEVMRQFNNAVEARR
jgi:hypothetical protein